MPRLLTARATPPRSPAAPKIPRASSKAVTAWSRFPRLRAAVPPNIRARATSRRAPRALPPRPPLVAEVGPRGGERGVGERLVGARRHGARQQVARRRRVEQAQAVEPLGVEAGGVRAGGEGDQGLAGLARRHLPHSQV